MAESRARELGPSAPAADVTRIEAWAGETRVNLVRLAAVALFYGRHLLDFYLNRPQTPEGLSYHTRVTWIVATWVGMVAIVHLRLGRREVSPELKYATVLWDAAMISLLCALAPVGPRSPLVLLYFALIATAPLRLSLRLVWLATAAAVFGYLCVLGHYAWRVVGYQKYYATAELRIPRSEEAVHVLALLVCGLLAGQAVRQARRLAAGYPVTVEAGPALLSEERPAEDSATAAAPAAAEGK
jgi:hypothetical protein